MLRWFEEGGNNSDVVISRRVRLARNINGYNFSYKMSDTDAKKLVKNVTDQLKTVSPISGYNSYNFDYLDAYQKMGMRERHVISPYLEKQDYAAGFVAPDEDVSIMINEEDHIREQAIESGFNLYKPYRKLKVIDDQIIANIPIAFDEKWGFITASPSNLGTGMRASVMLFLPALDRLGRINALITSAKENGLTVRGIYGEGSKALGQFYQISNQCSLGLNENEIIDQVSEFGYEICQKEQEARQYLLENECEKYKDITLRAYGVITNCFALDEEEMISLLSSVKLGQVLGFIDIKSEEEFQKLYFEGTKANLKELFEFFDEKKENIIRAEYISNKVKSLTERR